MVLTWAELHHPPSWTSLKTADWRTTVNRMYILLVLFNRRTSVNTLSMVRQLKVTQLACLGPELKPGFLNPKYLLSLYPAVLRSPPWHMKSLCKDLWLPMGLIYIFPSDCIAWKHQGEDPLHYQVILVCIHSFTLRVCIRIIVFAATDWVPRPSEYSKAEKVGDLKAVIPGSWAKDTQAWASVFCAFRASVTLEFEQLNFKWFSNFNWKACSSFCLKKKNPKREEKKSFFV